MGDNEIKEEEVACISFKRSEHQSSIIFLLL